MYPRLIADTVAQLHVQRMLSNPWHACVCYTDHGLETGFSLEPDAKAIPHLDLPLLRSDMALIADRLVSLVRERAQNYLDRYRHRAS